MSIRSRYLVLFASLLIGPAACESDNEAADAGTNNPNIVDGSVTFDTGTTTVDGGTADTGTTADAGEAGTAAPTFTQIYNNIIVQRCTPCHTTAGGIGVTMGHLDMTSQAAAFANLVGVAAAGVACAGHGTRVTPGNQETSIMYLKISLDDPAPCGSKMPLGLPALSKDEADAIENWIKSGAPNN